MKQDKKQLLTDARHWFETKHGKSPEEFGMKFVTIWRKPALFQKTARLCLLRMKKREKPSCGNKTLSCGQWEISGLFLFLSFSAFFLPLRKKRSELLPWLLAALRLYAY